jgi:hypothetical protein
VSRVVASALGTGLLAVSEDGIWGDGDCVWVTGQIGEEEATKAARDSGRFVGTGTKRGKPTGVVEQGDALETQA